MRSTRIPRRRFLASGVGVLGAGALAGLLAACGGGGSTPASSGTTAPSGGGAATTASGGATTASGQVSSPAAGSPASSSAASTAKGASQPPANAKRGGTLTWAYTAVPTKMDPVWTQARTDGTVLSNIVEGLVEANDKAELVPALAEKWDISTDGLTYTFHLRQGVKFHNGKAVTADDVLASLGRAKDMGVYKWTLESVTNMEKVDDSTVKITLGTKVASFLARIAVRSNAIFPADEIKNIGKDEFQKPIGTGPFVMKEWIRNDHVTLEKNPNYWRNAPDGKPYPLLDQIKIKQVPEVKTAILQIQSGHLNGIEGAPFSQIPTLQKNPSGQLLMFPQQQIYFMVVQVTKPPFDDVKVRQAMSLALDRKVFVDRATSGVAEIANSFMPKSGDCWNAGSKLPTDVEQAKKLIAESKYPQGHTTAKLQVPSGSTIGQDNAVLAKDMWDKIGIKLTIEQVESSTLSDNWYKGNYEAISGYQWTNGMADPEQLVQFFFIDPRMNSGYEPNQHAKDLVKDASQELDHDKRCKDYYELQDIYNQDVGGTISLYYTPSVNYVTPEVKDFYRSPLGVPFWWQTWLSK
jgi:peptide/nickel transport system substrate-binding protein